ncbi:MAG TPA: OmpA family protein [Bacteriovoracaceae bacterium]|nr:OmpA family protein [Bacteriovoracaceae bacterium]
MAKKFPSAPPDEPEGWLTSYADLMSLLSCFFMLMMAFANYETPGVQTRANIIAESFTKTAGQTEIDLDRLKNEIAHHPDFNQRTKLTLRDGELVIVFAGSAVFPEGAYLLDSSTVSMVDTLIDMVKAHNTDYRVLIEGHADKNESLLAGNMNHWSLSAARAAGVAARFEYFGFKGEYLAAIAKGDREPVSAYKEKTKDDAPIEDEVPAIEISKLNRRVVIRILEPLNGGKMGKVRVGVLFRDAEGGPPASDADIFRPSEGNDVAVVKAKTEVKAEEVKP